jgi:hypothetical protein
MAFAKLGICFQFEKVFDKGFAKSTRPGFFGFPAGFTPWAGERERCLYEIHNAQGKLETTEWRKVLATDKAHLGLE